MLRHAKRIFARNGYHRTNVGQIVRRARIARGTFYLYFDNKRDLFEELLAQALGEISARIRRLRIGPGEPDPVEQLRANLRRVLEFVLRERDLTDIVLNHSVGFDPELDAKVSAFYQRIAQDIKRSLDLGVEMHLVRPCDTEIAANCILGGIKEVVAWAARRKRPAIVALAEEILALGLTGVARPALLESAAKARTADGRLSGEARL